MELLDNIDNFNDMDDILNKPVELICNWIEEPLKRREHKRNMEEAEQTARLENEKREQEVKLESQRNEDAARLQMEQRRWNAEIDEMIAKQEDARRDKLVEALKKYQMDLASASRDIVESIGIMSIEMRRKANNLVVEKTREYKDIQDEAKKQRMQELKEAKEMFLEADPDTYRILVNDITQECHSMVETAGKFISELSEDLKRLNQNSDELMRMGMDAVNGYLKPMASTLGITASINADDISRRIEGSNIVEGKIVE